MLPLAIYPIPFIVLLVGLFLGGTLVHAQLPGTCTINCAADHPVMSPCKGGETGYALDVCLCSRFKASDDPFITCIQQCPWEEQVSFAGTLPSMCNRVLFPYIDTTDGLAPPRENDEPAAGQPIDKAVDATATATGSSSQSTTSKSDATSLSASAVLSACLDGLVGAIVVGAFLALM
ncbi:hypothetical protein ABEF95_008082 [Exophiala dermatitidis]